MSVNLEKKSEFSILPKNERNTRRNYPDIFGIFFHVFRLFSGKIEISKDCFRDLQTLKKNKDTFV